MNKRVVVAIMAAALIGAVLGPPMVQAATELVTIKGAGSKNKARVTGRGALRIDTEASVSQGFLNTFSLTSPAGIVTLADGTGDSSFSSEAGILTNVVIDLPSGAGPVTVTLSDGAGLIWQGTVDGGGRHLNDTFDSGLFWQGTLDIDVTGTGATWVLEGLAFGPAAAEDDSRLRKLTRLRR